jgi:hypothetical protein
MIKLRVRLVVWLGNFMLFPAWIVSRQLSRINRGVGIDIRSLVVAIPKINLKRIVDLIRLINLNVAICW